MSKLKVSTKDKIRDRALEMFNERGIEYVGLRELAAVLDMRVSNITYYFPTKDDLVFALAQELEAANSAVIVAHEELTMRAFLEMLHRVYGNHVRFRCLLLSVVHLMEQNPLMAERYKKTQGRRNSAMGANVEALARSGYLKLPAEGDSAYLVSAISLISRFWISEAAVSFRHLSRDAQVRHYLGLVAKLLEPYTSAKGKKEAQVFLEAL